MFALHFGVSCATVVLPRIVSCVFFRRPSAVNPYCVQSPVAAEACEAASIAAAASVRRIMFILSPSRF